MIKLNNVTKRFINITAVDQLSLEIGEGVSGLVGENGAGKSTLFRLIAGVYQPNEGDITIDGYSNNSEEGKSLLFFLADEPFYSLNNTPIDLYGVYSPFFEIDKQKYMSLLDDFHLPTRNRMATFSKGMKRQTFIALSLSMNVKYLLLDEAFDGLDPVVLDKIKEQITNKAKEGTSIIISTHNISLLEKLADRFIVLSKGRLSGNEDIKDIGSNLVKWQVLFNKDHSEEDFVKAGINIQSFNKVGSMIHFVTEENQNTEELINIIDKPIILEMIPLDKEETIKLMMKSEKEGR